MRISAVIPTYNRAHTLKRALDSAIHQTCPVDEIIVVNDGSTDSTSEMLASYSGIKIITQPNKGVSAARNAGIKKASGDWIALLDSDDEWLPSKIERIHQAHSEHPSIQLFHSDEIWIRNGVRVNPMNKHDKHGGLIFSHCLPLCVISPSAVVIDKRLLNETGLFDENLPACEDYDLWLRICHAHPVHFIDHPLIRKYGGHADQLSRKHWGMDRFRIQSLHRLLQSDRLSEGQARQARNMLIKKLHILLKGARKHDNTEVLEQFTPLLGLYESQTEVMSC